MEEVEEVAAMVLNSSMDEDDELTSSGTGTSAGTSTESDSTTHCGTGMESIVPTTPVKVKEPSTFL